MEKDSVKKSRSGTDLNALSPFLNLVKEENIVIPKKKSRSGALPDL